MFTAEIVFDEGDAASAAADEDLPRWDMTVLFPSLESPEFSEGFSAAVAAIADLKALYDAEGIRAPSGGEGIGGDAPAGADLIRRFEKIIAAADEVYRRIWSVRAFINAFVTTDSRDTLAQSRMSEIQSQSVTLSNLGTRFTAWLGGLDTEALISASPVAADHAFVLRRAKIAASHLLPPGEEELAAELSLSGAGAWSKLHSNLTSQIVVPLDGDDKPMSVIRALATDPDRDLRRRAYEAELASWEKNALPLAAAMNGIKHEQGALSRRRKWESPVDLAVFGNNIDRATLDAMLSAARESFPHFRRYLRAKAKIVSGDAKLPWFDLFAPVGGDGSRRWEWRDAEAFIVEQFGSYSPKMRVFAERAFRERWIDAGPRPGKRDGAFCMGIRAGESRVLQNYRPSFDGVSTLAHELGHGYHNLCLADRSMLQMSTPMTLAETASIFCETIVTKAALKTVEGPERLAILEASLQGSCQVVVDITSRFLFERETFERRRERELSIPEFCDIMLRAQKDTYGDGLDDNFLHPYMWAVKGHYYGPLFYNYPYMFGQLFGLGLYALYQQDPDAFRARYDELLSLTGMADAADLASRFGIDIRDETFWAGSLEVIREDIDRFEELARS